MPYEFYLSIDVTAEPNDATLSLVEETYDGRGDEAIYRIRHLAHFDASASSEKVAERLRDRLNEEPYIGRTTVVINRTDGVGQALLDQLQQTGLSPQGMIVTQGDAKAENKSGLFVSERELIRSVQNLYFSGRLKLPEQSTEETDELVNGLQVFLDGTGDDGTLLEVIEADDRQTLHHDFIFNVAMACWLAEQHAEDPTMGLR